jgi:hypothetical protein
MSVLAIAAFAGETSSPPCTPNPGETESPPCASAQMTTDDSVVPGQTNTPPAADAVDVSTIIEDTLIALLLF